MLGGESIIGCKHRILQVCNAFLVSIEKFFHIFGFFVNFQAVTGHYSSASCSNIDGGHAMLKRNRNSGINMAFPFICAILKWLIDVQYKK